MFGFGGSGLVSARALIAGGADVVASDDTADSLKKAEAAGIPIADLRAIDWTKIAALVLAPGVPLTHPKPHWTVELAHKAGVEVIGDIELFCRDGAASGASRALHRHHRHQRQIDDDGTDGASLRVGRLDAQIGGNIGTAILSLAPPQACIAPRFTSSNVRLIRSTLRRRSIRRSAF